MSYLVLARKWRPKTFEEVTGQEITIKTLTHSLSTEQLHQAYLFTGSRGVGKTTLGRILAKCLNCEIGITPTPCGHCSACVEIDEGRFVDLIEVDAASRTKVEDTRELLDNVQYAPAKGRFKVYLIDEVHMLSGHSVNAFLKTLEEPPAHIKFLLATTDPQKLPATILSRCLRFHLSLLTIEQMVEHMSNILKTEKVAHEQEALHLIAQAATGSMRDALSLLDQAIALGSGKVSTDLTRVMLGFVESQYIIQILENIYHQKADALFSIITQLSKLGVNYSTLLADITSTLHEIAVFQVLSPEFSSSSAIAPLATLLSKETVQLYYQIALIGQRDLLLAPSPRIGFEMTLLRMMAFKFNSADTPIVLTPKAQAIAHSAQKAPSAAAFLWEQVLPLLELTGAARLLAENCVFDKVVENIFSFILSPKNQPLLTDKYVQRIAQALSVYIQKETHVKIEIRKAETKTPAEFFLEQKEQKKASIKNSLDEAKEIKKIKQAFNAELVNHSIMTHSEGSDLS